MQGTRGAYQIPQVSDYGDLLEMTLACQGTGFEDGAAKENAPFLFSQPDFGDPGFCNGP